jgi:hypothetical protein
MTFTAGTAEFAENDVGPRSVLCESARRAGGADQAHSETQDASCQK